MTARPTPSRDRILAAATELFLDQGVEATSVAELCRAAGVSNGSFFHHFPSKEELALQVTLMLRREYWDYLLEGLEPNGDAMTGVANVIRAAFRYQREHPQRYRLSRSDDAPWMRGNEERVRDDNAPYRGRAANWIGAHVAAGRLAVLLPEIYGALLFGSAHWVARNANSGPTLTDMALAEEQLVRSVQKALAP